MEYCVVIRFDAPDDREATETYDLMREAFANNPTVEEVDALLERTTKGLIKVLRRRGYTYETKAQ